MRSIRELAKLLAVDRNGTSRYEVFATAYNMQANNVHSTRVATCMNHRLLKIVSWKD